MLRWPEAVQMSDDSAGLAGGLHESMTFPYVTDLLNAILGTQWDLPFPTFGLVVVAAVVLATAVVRVEAKRLESLGRLPPLTHALVSDLAFVATVAGIVGARVFHVADHWEAFLADPAAMIFSRSGFSIYGGLCFGIAAGVLFLRRRSVPIAPMLDAAAPALMLGYAVGRLGCQLAGDGDWGIAADLAAKPGWLPAWLWAQTYDGNILGVVIPEPGVYPTPIYESAAALVLFGGLWALRSHEHRAGYLFSAYLLCAGFERLLIEKIRINPEHVLLGIDLTQAEAVSAVLVIAGLAGMLAALAGRKLWPKLLLASGVLAALSACVPLPG
jgi:phosphatidylglycerol:prolipoprotein diacylglycerol transferase